MVLLLFFPPICENRSLSSSKHTKKRSPSHTTSFLRQEMWPGRMSVIVSHQYSTDNALLALKKYIPSTISSRWSLFILVVRYLFFINEHARILNMKTTKRSSCQKRKQLLLSLLKEMIQLRIKVLLYDHERR